MNSVASKKWSAIIFLLAILIGTLILSGVPFLVSRHNAHVYEGLASGTGSGSAAGPIANGGGIYNGGGSAGIPGSAGGGIYNGGGSNSGPGSNGGGIYPGGGSNSGPGSNGGGIYNGGSPPASNQNILIPVASFNAFISSMMTDATTFFGSVKSANAQAAPANAKAAPANAQAVPAAPAAPAPK